MKKLALRIIFWILIAVIIITIIPYLFSMQTEVFTSKLDLSPDTFSSYDDNCSKVGDTIGGITAPFIGLVSIILLYYTLKEQLNFNREQKEIEYDEQFKSTFFNLLKVQRSLLDKMYGYYFVCNGENVDRIYSEGKSFLKNIIQELNTIYEILGNARYDSVNKLIFVQTSRDPLQNKIIQYYQLTNFRCPNSEDKNVCITHYGSMQFFIKQHDTGFYFRHLYRMLVYIDKSKQDKINRLGKNISYEKEIEIEDYYKNFGRFIQAQLTVDELVFIFYDSLLYPRMRNLLIDYHIFDSLMVWNLLKKEHNIIGKYNIKTDTELHSGYRNQINELIKESKIKNQ